MTVGLVLLAYALGLGSLRRLGSRPNGWLARSPRIGATLLLAAAWSVVAALFLAGLTIALPATALSSGLSDLVGACIVRLRTAYLTPGGAAAAGAGVTLSVTIAVRTAWASIAVTRARCAERRRQHALLTTCGTRRADLDAVVVDSPECVAYCVAGRVPTVVVTTGVVDLLNAEQLRAVLAHEHAHGRAGHHRLLTAAAVAGRALPELALPRALPGRVRNLLELHADETAAGQHASEQLATALVAMATRRGRAADRSVAALAATGSDMVARIDRLLTPPATPSRRARAGLRAAVVALSMIPLLVALAPAEVAATQPPVRQAVLAAGSPSAQ